MENQEEKLLKLVKSLQAEHRSLIRLILRKEELAIGTVYKVNKRCGSPYCHCKKGPGHPHTLFMFTEKGKRRCKFVRQADVPKMRKAAERYKKKQRCHKAFKVHPFAGNQDFNGPNCKKRHKVSVSYLTYYDRFI